MDMITSEEKGEVLELWMTEKQKNRWEKMANVLGLSLYEYVRRCADAHTTILETDSFKIVHDISEA